MDLQQSWDTCLGGEQPSLRGPIHLGSSDDEDQNGGGAGDDDDEEEENSGHVDAHTAVIAAQRLQAMPQPIKVALSRLLLSPPAPGMLPISICLGPTVPAPNPALDL